MMDRDEIIRGLMAQNVPRWKAEQTADAQIAEASRQLPPSPFGRGRAGAKTEEAPVILHAGAARIGGDPFATVSAIEPASGAPIPVAAAYHWPFRMVLPWSHLVSDNRKYAPALRGGRPAIILTVEYRNAKRLAVLAARRAWGEAPAFSDGLLQLDARVYFPNSYRKRDAHNFQKCAHDALTGIVYDDDSQLVPRWIPAGVDVDAPRAELVIFPHPPV